MTSGVKSVPKAAATARGATRRRPNAPQQTRHGRPHGDHVALGVDIGGTGIKGAPVDLIEGTLLGDRFRLDTPRPATPDAVAETVGRVARHFGWAGRTGVTFPGVIVHGVVHTAVNMDSGWVGISADDAFRPELGPGAAAPVVLNDADAAGLAEVTHGAGRGQEGVVLMLTFGTGIGSALFIDGRLVPNTELGHIEVRGKDAEHRASAKVKEDRGLSWKQWSARVQEYLDYVEALFSPDLVIIGGGVSKRPEKFLPRLKLNARIVPAEMANNAGIIGAALAAAPRALSSK
jgi:polyphosphate glucokinase